MGDDAFGINQTILSHVVTEIKSVIALGVQVGVVIGGGNIFRGVSGAASGMERTTADYMGMMATIMNCMALNDALNKAACRSRVQSALKVGDVLAGFNRSDAVAALESGEVVIFAAGTGNPFFTTDTAAALRGAEIDAHLVLKATKVDGVYTADPKKDTTATRYARVTFDEAISRNLGVMDLTAFALCRERQLPVNVFSIFKTGALTRVVLGEDEGTLVYC